MEKPNTSQLLLQPDELKEINPKTAVNINIGMPSTAI